MDTSNLYIEIERLTDELSSVKQELKKVTTTLKNVEKENNLLREQLAKYQTPKHSGNSSMPPSKDENRAKPNQSLRESSGRKVGGQKGRIGKTLAMRDNPDQIIKLVPDYCTSCGNSLQDFPSQKEQSRQVVDIPVIKAVYKEYQTFSKVCSCGCQTTFTLANFCLLQECKKCLIRFLIPILVKVESIVY